MPHPSRRLGKRDACPDHRVAALAPRLAAAHLPPPPPGANWYAEVGDPPMLMNDQLGCCTAAAIGHALQQVTAYKGTPLVMTDAEVEALYQATSGYRPGQPGTDNGAFMLGPSGVVPYWAMHGVTIGGQLTRADALVVVNHRSVTEIRQAIHLFGGVLGGFQLPESAVDADFMWDRTDGPIAGGHEVWLNGYQAFGDGYAVYDLVSWGRQYRCTEAFLLTCADEMIAVFDDVGMNARGVDARGLDRATLMADMQMLTKGYA